MDAVRKPNFDFSGIISTIISGEQDIDREVIAKAIEDLQDNLNDYHKDEQHFNSDIYVWNGLTLKGGYYVLEELINDPDDPASGNAVIWLSATDDGSLRMKYTDSSGTKEGVIAWLDGNF